MYMIANRHLRFLKSHANDASPGLELAAPLLAALVVCYISLLFRLNTGSQRIAQWSAILLLLSVVAAHILCPYQLTDQSSAQIAHGAIMAL